MMCGAGVRFCAVKIDVLGDSTVSSLYDVIASSSCIFFRRRFL